MFVYVCMCVIEARNSCCQSGYTLMRSRRFPWLERRGFVGSPRIRFGSSCVCVCVYLFVEVCVRKKVLCGVRERRCAAAALFFIYMKPEIFIMSWRTVEERVKPKTAQHAARSSSEIAISVCGVRPRCSPGSSCCTRDA